MTVLLMGEELLGEFRVVRMVEPDPHSQKMTEGENPQIEQFPQNLLLTQTEANTDHRYVVDRSQTASQRHQNPFFASS